MTIEIENYKHNNLGQKLNKTMSHNLCLNVGNFGIRKYITPSGGVEGRAEVVCLRDMVKIWRVGLRCLGEKILGAIVESLEARRWRLDVSRRHQKLGTVGHVMRRFISVETDVINVGDHVMRSSFRSSWDPRGKS